MKSFYSKYRYKKLTDYKCQLYSFVQSCMDKDTNQISRVMDSHTLKTITETDYKESLMWQTYAFYKNASRNLKSRAKKVK